ncbi:armadillo repeat containing 1 [Pitangus sulphuratus]|nr:armadillo repeat containing 1 [Pitangus sulphuratus]
MHGAEKMNSAMSEEPDALSVVNQLRDLAADPLNRRAIVQDQGCLPGLILFLDHPNPPVVHSALLALRYLAECRVNREKMKSELGMMLSLQNVIQKTTTPGETKLLASEVYDILQSSNMSDMDNVNEMNYRRRKAQFFLGSTNKRAKTVVLHIDGLDDSSRRNLCEEALLKIKGVISFTFQMAVQRCVVRIRSDLKAEALATAIASTKVMKAQQVVKSESGEEMLVPFQDTPVEVEQNTDLPEYLPEDESPTKEQDKAVSRVGSHPEGEMLQSSYQHGGPPLDSLQQVDVFIVLGVPELGTAFQVGCHRNRVEGRNHPPKPADHTSFDAAQDVVGLLGCKCTLPSRIKLFIHKHQQVILARTNVYQFSAQPAPGLGIAPTQVQHLALGLVELREVCTSPPLQLSRYLYKIMMMADRILQYSRILTNFANRSLVQYASTYTNTV